MPHELKLSGINMFKKRIVEFSKNLENSDFLKCVKNLPVEKIRMFDFFQAGRAPSMTPVPHFNKVCALTNFYLKTSIFALLYQKRV